MIRPSEAVRLPPEWVGFEYPIDGSWWEFAGWIDDCPRPRRCRCWMVGGYFYPIDRPHPRPDLPGLILNFAELTPLTRTARELAKRERKGRGR